MTVKHATLILTLALGATGLAHAQATLKRDGQFRASLGLGASASSGNSDAANLALTFDGVRATETDKTSLSANAQYAKSEGSTTAEKVRLGGRQDHDLNPAWFAFGGLDFEHDKFANLKLRSQASGGLGRHMIKSDTTTFDLFAGLGYTYDKYESPMLVDGRTRESFDYASVLLGEESTHKLTETTSLKQRLTVLPNLQDSGEFRATWDAGLAVAMSATMNLTLGVSVTHNSDPGPDRKSTDTLLTTGVSVKFE